MRPRRRSCPRSRSFIFGGAGYGLANDVSLLRGFERKVSVSASYRFALPTGEGLTRLAFEDVSGPAAGINLKFGSF